MSALDVRSIDEKDLRHKPCPAVKHEFRVVLSEQAFDRAVARGDSDTTREIGGVLVGELLKDDAGPYLSIDGTVDALHAEEKGAELTFTHATWQHIHKEMDTRHHNKRVVGWYHTHPGFGIFLSDRDQFIHKSFFNLPFQVALVYDPKTHEHGMFTWHDGEVRRARRYWTGSREQTWDGSRGPGDAADRKAIKPDAGELTPKVDSREELTLSGLMGPLVVLGLALLLIGGFVGHWLGSGSAANLQAQAAVEIAKAKTEGAQLAIGSLQSDLLVLLRDTLGDEAVRKPVAQAVGEIDHLLAVLATDGASPAGPLAAPPIGPPVGPPVGPPGAVDDARLRLASQLAAARQRLLQVAQGRATAMVELAQLEQQVRSGTRLRPDLGNDVAEQRSGLGTLYAELANDAAKAHDLARARRLLATAAHFDPRNRVRYEKQLQSFDPKATLPPENLDKSTGEGTTR